MRNSIFKFDIYFTDFLTFSDRMRKIATCIYSNGDWIWGKYRLSNYNMALILIEILYEKNLINEATYKSIMKKSSIQNKIA